MRVCVCVCVCARGWVLLSLIPHQTYFLNDQIFLFIIGNYEILYQ